jgi:crotonobetainyl-CoA:carnitine CoA-transferase CaiB-like acyl-CoA transferase
MVAGGLAGMLLADFGADVIKVEQPGTGDPLRQWTTQGHAFWWQVYGRNKRYITLNLKAPEGRAVLQRLVPKVDVVMESFVPGTLERMGLGYDVLRQWNPGLILARISGWGQDGPSSQRPGFGTLVEAASGFAAMNGEPDGPPIVPSFPMADMTTGLYCSNAIMFALYHRHMHGGQGQVIDLALFESLFSVLGPLAAEYGALGLERTRQGSRSRNSGPRGCFATSDGEWLAVSGACGGARCRRARRHRGPHAGREPRGDRIAWPDRRARADHQGHRARSALACAPPDRRGAGRGWRRADAERHAAPLGDARRDSLERRPPGRAQRRGLRRVRD